MRIRAVKGDVVDVAQGSADAAVLWIRGGFNVRCLTWSRFLDRNPNIQRIKGQAQADKPWHSPKDSVWATHPDQGRLRYLYVFSNPDDRFGFHTIEEVKQAVDHSLTCLARLGVRVVAFIHIPVEPLPAPQEDLQGGRLSDRDQWEGTTEEDDLRSAEAMVQALQDWGQLHPDGLDEVLLVDFRNAFYSLLGPQIP